LIFKNISAIINSVTNRGVAQLVDYLSNSGSVNYTSVIWLFVNSWGKKSSKKIERVKDGFEK